MDADTTPQQFVRTAQQDTYAVMATSKPLVQGLSVVSEQPELITRRALIDEMARADPPVK